MEDLVIGIDLGTTNSCVSLYLNGRTSILENADGGRITPSFIFFTSLDETLIGEHAKRLAGTKPDHGIYEVKRLVGRKFNDACIQNNMKYVPFKLESDPSGDPVIVIEQRNKVLRKSPLELCAAILQKLKQDVEEKLGHTVKKVVITVPAYFNVSQREVTLAAAKDAGFIVLKLLNEPTAAALFYYFQHTNTETNYSLVYDLGGGTFDVAILKRHSNNIEIVCVDGDTQLGGHDFDNLIMEHVCEILKKNYNYDPKTDKENLRRLRNKCEDAKRALSSTQKTIIVLIGFVPNYSNVQIELTRKQFEEIADNLFKRTMTVLDNCITNSGISKKIIQEVILSGGSTRVPKIQKMLSEYFDGKTLNKFINPDECVAEGAALQAAMLSKCTQQNIQKIKMTDVLPLSIGIPDFVDEMTFLIRRNSPIPARALTTRCTLENDQSKAYIGIYEGERLDARKNRFLGGVSISDLTLAPPGQCEVTAELNVDENGILTITAKEKYRDNVKELKINYTRGNQSDEEIKNALSDAVKYKEEDERFAQFSKIKGYLIKYCVATMYNLDKRQLAHRYATIYELCKETKKEAEDLELEGKSTAKELIEELKLQCEPIVKYYNFDLMPKLT